MGYAITFSGMKDGIGKTTLAIHVAHILHKLGYNILLLDLDSKHSEMTKKMFPNKAMLKNFEYKDQIFQSFQEAISLDINNDFPYEELCLNIHDSQSENCPIMFRIIPSYYREPKPFWEKEEVETQNTIAETNLQEILAYFKEKVDFLIIDTISHFDFSFYTCLDISEYITFISPSSKYFLYTLEEYIDYLNIVKFSENAWEKEYMICENMVMECKADMGRIQIPFIKEINNFDNTRSYHRCRFFWEYARKNQIQDDIFTKKILELCKSYLMHMPDFNDSKLKDLLTALNKGDSGG